MKCRVAILFLSSMLSFAPQSACSAAERLPKREELMVPVSELSGLALRGLPEGGFEILAVADEANELVVVPLGRQGLEVERLRRIHLPLAEREGGSEFEGVTVDGEGLVHILIESGAVVSFRIVKDVAFLVRERTISVGAGHPLEKAWQGDENARGEGLVWADGRLFIVKQEAPVALIELEDRGTSFEMRRYWNIDGLEDASDVALGPSGLYVVGAKTGMACLIPVPKREDGPLKGGAISCLKRWDLPGVLGDGKVRWEGLAILPDGSTLAGVDRKKTDSPNLAILPAMR